MPMQEGNMKRGIAPGQPIRVALIGLVTLVLAACSTGGSSNPPGAAAGSNLTIAVVGYEHVSGFWNAVEKGAHQAATDFGVTVNYSSADATTPGMVRLAQAALASHPYGICLDYIDHGMFDVTKSALAQGTKVVLYNNNLFQPEAGGATTDPAVTSLPYVGQNNAPGTGSSGEVLGDAFVRSLPPGGGEVLIVNPFPQAFVLTLRYQAVKLKVEQHGYTTDQLLATGDEGQNVQLIGAYLTAHHNVVGIVGLGTPGANPAASYVKSKNLTIPVATFDVDTVAAQNIHAGLIKDAVFQEPYLQAYLCIEDLWLQSKALLPVNMNTGNTIIDSSNISVVDNLIAKGLD
jgi:simple sugar transport system substrate-binding protein